MVRGVDPVTEERCIASLKSPNGNIIELCEDESGYYTRLYVPEPDSDHRITRQDATEWLKVVRSCGGTIHEHISVPRHPAAS